MTKLEKKLKEKDEDLNTKVNALESKIDDLEQYSRRISIRIHGLKKEEDENIEAKVGNVMKVLVSIRRLIVFTVLVSLSLQKTKQLRLRAKS